MKPINRDDAEAIAFKLQAVREPGRKHDQVKFYYKGKLILSFGIRRGSAELPHTYIPNQMKISQKDCRLFRKCDISLESYIETLKIKQFILD